MISLQISTTVSPTLARTEGLVWIRSTLTSASVPRAGKARIVHPVSIPLSILFVCLLKYSFYQNCDDPYRAFQVYSVERRAHMLCYSAALLPACIITQAASDADVRSPEQHPRSTQNCADRLVVRRLSIRHTLPTK